MLFLTKHQQLVFAVYSQFSLGTSYYTPLADRRHSQTASALHNLRSLHEIPSASEQWSLFNFAPPLNRSFCKASQGRWKTAPSF